MFQSELLEKYCEDLRHSFSLEIVVLKNKLFYVKSRQNMFYQFIAMTGSAIGMLSVLEMAMPIADDIITYSVV